MFSFSSSYDIVGTGDNMKKIKMMYLKNCPHCKAAFQMMKELQSEDERFSQLEIETIEEEEYKEIADQMDYWYVPAYFVDGIKLFEGVPSKDAIRNVFLNAITK